MLRNKAFFFATYEGYQENVQLNLNQVVPYKEVRDEILRALPFPETATVLEVLPLPTEPIVSSQGVVDRESAGGAVSAPGNARRMPPLSRAKAGSSRGDLAVTYTRLRPFTLEPRPVLNNANDREYPNEQDRVAAQLVMTRGPGSRRAEWVEQDLLARLDAFLSVKGPNAPPEILRYGRRMPAFEVSNLFATPRSEIWDMKGSHTASSRSSLGTQRHLVKAGFRFMRETGGRLNPENPSFTYQTYADLLANIPQSLSTRSARRRTTRPWISTAGSFRTIGAWATASC